jgi:hypothetical protein
MHIPDDEDSDSEAWRNKAYSNDEKGRNNACGKAQLVDESKSDFRI